MSISRLDADQITKIEHDEATGTKKVSIANTSVSIDLDHTDGDSVTSHPAKLIASALGVVSPTDDGTEIIPALDCSSLREIHVSINGTGTVDVEVSPNDSGTYFYSLGGAGTIHTVCARRVRVRSINANGDVHLVGRS